MTFIFTTPIKSKSVASSHTHDFVTPPTVISENNHVNENDDSRIIILKEKTSIKRRSYR